MSHTIIDLPSVRDDGRLYRDTALNFVESLIPNPWNSCHAPDLLELENGDLLCCWFAGSCEGNADVSIAVSRLSEDSSQWETPVIVSDDPTRSEQNPSLFLHPNGEIWLMYTAQVSRDPNNPTSDNLQGTAEIRRKISRDNGHTWEATETMFSAPGSFCRQKIQILSNGRFIFNNFRCAINDSCMGDDYTVLQLSDDQGKTWRSVMMPGSRGRVHGNIVELSPGNLICLLRSALLTIFTVRNPMITARPGACRSLLCCATTTQALPQSVFKAAQSALYTMTSPSMTSPSAPSGPTSAVLSYSPFPRTEEKPGPGGVSSNTARALSVRGTTSTTAVTNIPA